MKYPASSPGLRRGVLGLRRGQKKARGRGGGRERGGSRRSLC